ncbi:MAG: flagellar hook-basal body complex protein FliE [Bdellovibrionota bacterium]
MSEMGIKGGGLTSMLERQLLGREMTAAKNAEMKSALSETAAAGASGQSSGSFLDSLKSAIETTNDLQKNADTSAKNFAAGNGSLHETLIAMEKADISLRTITSIRGKLIEAYQEVMKMPV